MWQTICSGSSQNCHLPEGLKWQLADKCGNWKVERLGFLTIGQVFEDEIKTLTGQVFEDEIKTQTHT